MTPEAVVLAGGLGTRLRHVVKDLPKPMAPVNGRPFLELLLEYWIGQGVRRFVLSVGYLAETIERHFGSRWGGAEMDYAREAEPLGTGGGLLIALGKMKSEQVLVMNGDTYFAVPLRDFLDLHEGNRADWSMALFRSTDSRRYQGVSLADDGRITSLAGDTVNGGVYLVRRGLPWEARGRCSLENDLLPHALARGWRLYGRVFDRPFVDIGVPQDYQSAGAIIQ
ncbi:MAG TPA: nucleotidyltransferase family protein [Burkholderiales bacterium]|nr:nucleotidyltransferase family protein [Burkholderiales bacterium]